MYVVFICLLPPFIDGLINDGLIPVIRQPTSGQNPHDTTTPTTFCLSLCKLARPQLRGFVKTTTMRHAAAAVVLVLVKQEGGPACVPPTVRLLFLLIPLSVRSSTHPLIVIDCFPCPPIGPSF